MRVRKPWRTAKVLGAAAGLAFGICAAASPAQAVFLEADKIDADGATSSIDLWFFSFDAAAMATIQVNDLGGPPIAGADPDLILYRDNGPIWTFLAADTAAGSDPAISLLFDAGNYVGVVANHLLSFAEFGPTQPDAALASGGYDYEFNGPEPVGGTISLNCVLSGNLDGSYTTRVLAEDTCHLPRAATIPEPATLGLLGFGLLGLARFGRRRKA